MCVCVCVCLCVCVLSCKLDLHIQPALNGPNSHTHFCLFSLSEPGGRTQMAWERNVDGGGRRRTNIASICRRSFFLRADFCVICVYSTENIKTWQIMELRGRLGEHDRRLACYLWSERGCCQALCRERKIDHRTSFF